MLYSEFAEATGCRDNEANRRLFDRLEIIYMQDESITKAEIYEMGKKLMNNEESAECKAIKAEMQKEIANCKEEIRVAKQDIELYKSLLEYPMNEKEEIKRFKYIIKCRREWIAEMKKRIKSCEWVMA